MSTLLGRWRALAAVTALAAGAALAVGTLQASADQKQDGAAGAEQKPPPGAGEQKPGGSGAEPGGEQKPPAPGEPKPAAPAAAQRIPVGPTVTEASVEVPALTLEESIAVAEGINPQITIARSQVGQAQALARERGAERLPTVTLNGGIHGVTPPIITGGTGSGLATTSLTTNARADLLAPIFDSGLREARQRSARHLARAQTHFLIQTREDLALAVATAFYDVLRGRQLIQVAEQRLTAAQAHLRVAAALVGEGVAPSFDVIRTRAEVANAQQQVEVARGDMRIAEASFNNTLGRDTRLPVRLIEPPDLPDVPVTIDQAIQAAYEYRPQLKALREVIRSAEQDIRAARASGRPEIDLDANYGRTSPPTFNSNFSGLAGITFTYPLFDANRVKYLTQQFIQLAVQRRGEAEQARQAIELQIRAALERLVEARARMIAAQVELQSATRSLEIANVRYRAGRATNVELTDAQVELATAGEDVANARYDYLTQARALEHATGATFAAILAQPAAPVRPGGETPPEPGTPSGLPNTEYPTPNTRDLTPNTDAGKGQ